MPIRDVAAMNASLDNDYGTTRGANAADAHEVALFVGDPIDDGVELDPTDNPGYARPVADSDDWPAAAGGAKTQLVQYADATDEWLDSPTHWALIDHSDHTTMWDCAPLREPLLVTSAGDGPQVAVIVFYADVLDPDS